MCTLGRLPEEAVSWGAMCRGDSGDMLQLTAQKGKGELLKEGRHEELKMGAMRTALERLMKDFAPPRPPPSRSLTLKQP